MRTDKTKLCDDIGDLILDILYDLLGDKFEVWSTGTINPDYYERHKKLGEMGGQKIIITLKDYNPHPTYEQISNYFKGVQD